MRFIVIIAIALFLGFIALNLLNAHLSEGKLGFWDSVKQSFSSGPKMLLIEILISLVVGGIILLILSSLARNSRPTPDDGMWFPH